MEIRVIVCDKCGMFIHPEKQEKTVINQVEYDLCPDCRQAVLADLEGKGRPVVTEPPASPTLVPFIQNDLSPYAEPVLHPFGSGSWIAPTITVSPSFAPGTTWSGGTPHQGYTGTYTFQHAGSMVAVGKP